MLYLDLHIYLSCNLEQALASSYCIFNFFVYAIHLSHLGLFFNQKEEEYFTEWN